MTQRVRADLAFQAGYGDGFLKGRLDRLYWPPVELDKMLRSDALVVPPAKMGEEARRQRNWRLPFAGRRGALRQPIEDAGSRSTKERPCCATGEAAAMAAALVPV